MPEDLGFKLRDARAIFCGNQDGIGGKVFDLLQAGFQFFRVQPIGLIQHGDYRDAVDPVPESVVAGGKLLVDDFGFFAYVCNKEDDIREENPVQGGLESVHHPVGKFFDKAHGIGKKRFSPSQVQRPGHGDQGCKEHVHGFGLFVHQGVEKGAFPGIRVSGKRNQREALPVSVDPQGLVVLFRSFQLAFYPGNPLLQVLFVGIFIASEPHEPWLLFLFQDRHDSPGPRELVFKLCKFHLEFGTVGGGPFCKDFKDKLELVNYPAPAEFRDVIDLGCGELVVKNNLFRPRDFHKFGKFLYLPPSQLVSPVREPGLGNFSHGTVICSLCKFPEFLKKVCVTSPFRAW